MPPRGRGGRRGGGTISKSFRIDPSPAELAKTFGHLGKEFSNFKPAFQKAAPDVVAGIEENIRTRGASANKPWGGLNKRSKRYISSKAREGGGTAELVLTGKLMSQAEGVRKGVYRINARKMVLGVRTPYARAVNFGRKGDGRRGSIKPRPFMRWSPAMVEAVEYWLTKRAQQLMARAEARIQSGGGSRGR